LEALRCVLTLSSLVHYLCIKGFRDGERKGACRTPWQNISTQDVNPATTFGAGNMRCREIGGDDCVLQKFDLGFNSIDDDGLRALGVSSSWLRSTALMV
jgi:hypothetical protein